MGWESPRKKKRRRYYNSRMRDLEAINIKYTQEFQKIGLGGVLRHNTIYGDNTGGMFLSYKEKDEPAWEYAKKKADASLTWYQSLVSGNIGQAFVSFIIATALIVVNFVTAGATTPITIATFTAASVAATTALVTNIAMNYYSMKAGGRAGLAQSKQGAVLAYKNKELVEQQSNALTNLIIYGGYEIYANGSIFKQGQSGSESFCFDKAFDGTKGLRGDLSRDELTEQIHSRIGANAAGGVNFHSNLLSVDFPLKSFDLSKDALQDALINRYRLAMDILAAAFVELNNYDFNANGRAGEVYNQKLELYTRPTKRTIYQNDFLDKLKNYNKDLRADFNFADDKMFRSKKENTKDIKGALGAIDSLDDLMNDEELSDEFKANYYIDLVVSLLDLLEDFADSGVVFSCRYVYGWEQGVGENASGGYYERDYTLITPLHNYFHRILTYEYEYINKQYTDAYEFLNAHGGQKLYCLAQSSHTAYHTSSTSGNQIEFIDFSEFGFLQKYYHKSTNKTFNGDEILKIYDELLKSLYAGAGRYGIFINHNVCCFVYNYNVFGKKELQKVDINYLFLNLGREVFDIFNTRLKMPERLKYFDFSTIEKEIINQFDESDTSPRDDED